MKQLTTSFFELLNRAYLHVTTQSSILSIEDYSVHITVIINHLDDNLDELIFSDDIPARDLIDAVARAYACAVENLNEDLVITIDFDTINFSMYYFASENCLAYVA